MLTQTDMATILRSDRWKQIYNDLEIILKVKPRRDYKIEWRRGKKIVFQLTVGRAVLGKLKFLELTFIHQASDWLARKYQLNLVIDPKKFPKEIVVLARPDGALMIHRPDKLVSRIVTLIHTPHSLTNEQRDQIEFMVIDCLLAELHHYFCVDFHPEEVIWQIWPNIKEQGYEIIF